LTARARSPTTPSRGLGLPNRYCYLPAPAPGVRRSKITGPSVAVSPGGRVAVAGWRRPRRVGGEASRVGTYDLPLGHQRPTPTITITSGSCFIKNNYDLS
jgi:hypothetical protein